jgi:hypothetical protein
VVAGFALEALRQHRVRQQEARRLAGDAWQDHDYVFCTPLGTHLNPGHSVLVQLKILLEKAGLGRFFWVIFPGKMPRARIELATPAFSVLCSTD